MRKVYKITLLMGVLLIPVLTKAESISLIQTEASEKLESAIAELATLQESISTEKVPLAKMLNSLEVDVSSLKDDLRRLERLRDTRDLNLSALEAKLKRDVMRLTMLKICWSNLLTINLLAQMQQSFNYMRKNF